VLCTVPITLQLLRCRLASGPSYHPLPNRVKLRDPNGRCCAARIGEASGSNRLPPRWARLSRSARLPADETGVGYTDILPGARQGVKGGIGEGGGGSVRRDR